MDIKWLEDFISLAQTRNFSRSADDRNVTQSALSRRIQSLEAWVGADLVDRGSYPLVLTPAGKLFGAAATEAVRLLNDTRAMLRVEQTNDQVLRVSAGHALSLNFFPNWLNSVQAWHGPLPARILPTNVHDSVLALVEGNCDLLLCYHHADLPVELDARRFEYLHLGDETVMPVCVPNRAGSPAFALPGGKAAPLPYLSYTATSYFGRVVQRLQERAGQPAEGARQPEPDDDAAIDVGPQQPQPLDRADGVGDGHGGDGELGADLEREDRRQDRADPEPGHRRERARQQPGASERGEDEWHARSLRSVTIRRSPTARTSCPPCSTASRTTCGSPARRSSGRWCP